MVKVMTETNRKDHKQIDKNKVYSMLVIVLVLIALIGKVTLFNNNIIKSEIISCEQDQDLSTVLYAADSYSEFGMSDAESKDIQENPESYRGYYIGIKINNISEQMVLYTETLLAKRYQGIWIFRPGIPNWHDDVEGQYEIQSNRSIVESVCIIVKTANMTEEQINQLIKSIGLTINARIYEELPIYVAETIYFGK